MSQITNGIRRILSSPIVYNSLQTVMGASKVRKELVTDFMCPKPDWKILDIGCGTAEILRYLPSTVDYWGFDISSKYIASAEATFGSRGHFRCGLLNKSDLETLPKFDLVLFLGVLHHLEDKEASDLFSLAKQFMEKDGKVVTIDPCFAERQNPVARLLIQQDRGQNVRNSEGYLQLAKGAFQNVSGTLRHRSWIPYTHWVMVCSDQSDL